MAALLKQLQAIHTYIWSVHVSDGVLSSPAEHPCAYFSIHWCVEETGCFLSSGAIYSLPTVPAFHMLYHIRHSFFHFNRILQYKTTVPHQLRAIWLPRYITQGRGRINAEIRPFNCQLAEWTVLWASQCWPVAVISPLLPLPPPPLPFLSFPSPPSFTWFIKCCYKPIHPYIFNIFLF